MKQRTSRAARPQKPARPVFTPLPPPDAGAGIPDRPHAPGADPELRRAMIAEAAYFRAEQRGFEPGRELDDWYAAECDVDAQLAPGSAPTPCGP